MDEPGALKSRLDLAAAGLRRAIEANAEAERVAARHTDLPGVASQLQVVRAAVAAAVSADTAAQRTHAALQQRVGRGGEPSELELAFFASTEAVGHAADAAAQALGVLASLVNQRARFQRRSGRP